MNDRYLYRAKRCDNGELVQGYLVYDNRDKLYRIIMEIQYSTGTCITTDNAPRVDSSTICQCTGLKDKNGKLIWENDIVGYYNKYVGKWCYGLVGYGEFNCSCCSGVYGWHFGDEDIREYQGYEVKGNKFDNPELLESEEKE